jgi:saccharopine dehydrogenase-like NADP-dependent oxidoreductase
MRVLLLGVGMQGKAALHDLTASSDVDEVIAADADIEMLESYVGRASYGGSVRCEAFDAADPASLRRLMQMQPDVAVSLLPKVFTGLVARAAIESGVHFVNTSYVPAELRVLDAEARRRGVTILPEFGLDPGIDLVMLGEAYRSLDTIEEIRSYGAGVPELDAADNPLHYKVSWTLEGVLESYRRPARLIREGTVVELDPAQVFSPENVDEVDVAGLGVLEVYPNGDAVRYVEALGLDPQALRAAGRYTLRWPGHCAFWKKVVDLHLLDRDPVTVDGLPVDRLRFLAAAIGPHIQYGPGERDVAFVRVEVVGRRAGQRRRLRYEMADWRDLTTGLMAMSRTVGFTASIGAILIGTGVINRRGLMSPVTDVPYRILADELARRGIQLTRKETRA